MAGIWREYKDGEAFTLLTMDSGPDIAAYHHRQIIPLARDQWAAWLDPRVPAADVLKWLPEGSLQVAQVYGKPPAQRSAERRVGKGSGRLCRSGCRLSSYKNKSKSTV